MRIFRKIAVLAIVAMAVAPAFAQVINNPLQGKDSVTLVGKYQAELEDMDKPEVKLPEISSGAINTDDITYEEKKFEVKTSYTPPSPRMTTPPKPTWPKLNNNLLRLGYGRFGTLLGQLYLHNGRNANGDIGLDFTHFSSSNTSSGYEDFAELREDYGSLTAKRTLDQHTIGARVDFFNTRYFYFADTIVDDQPELKDSITQSFTKFGVTAGLMKNYKPGDLYYNVDLGFKGFFDRRKNQDIHVSAFPELNWAVNENFSAGIKSELTFSNTTFNDTAQSRFFLDFAPTVKFSKDGFVAEGGIKVNSFSDTSSVFRAFPILKASYVIAEQFKVSAGLQGEMFNNTYYDQIAENPYIRQRADILPSIEKLNLYAGIDGTFADYFNLSVQGYLKRIENQLMYFNPQDGAYFQAVYDSSFRTAGAKIRLDFNKDDKIKAGVAGEFRSFKTGSQPYFYAMPKTRVDFFASYNFADKVWASAEVYLYGARTMTIDTAGNPINQSAMADVNLQVDYRFSKRISIFLELNNILGNRYYRWYNYRQRPFDIKGGVTLAF